MDVYSDNLNILTYFIVFYVYMIIDITLTISPIKPRVLSVFVVATFLLLVQNLNQMETEGRLTLTIVMLSNKWTAKSQNMVSYFQNLSMSHKFSDGIPIL